MLDRISRLLGTQLNAVNFFIGDVSDKLIDVLLVSGAEEQHLMFV